jgi:hypothetical protein
MSQLFAHPMNFFYPQIIITIFYGHETYHHIFTFPYAFPLSQPFLHSSIFPPHQSVIIIIIITTTTIKLIVHNIIFSFE